MYPKSTNTLVRAEPGHATDFVLAFWLFRVYWPAPEFWLFRVRRRVPHETVDARR